MKRFFSLLLGAALLLMTGATFAQSDTNSLNYNGVSFSFPRDLAAGVDITTFAAEPLDLAYPGGPQPARTVFALYNYDQAADQREFIGEIHVYNLADLAGYPAEQEAIALTNTLDAGPDLSEFDGGRGIPFLPVFPASQVLRARAEYTEFNGLRGIQFVTAFRQDASPLVARDFIYTFQGLTADNTTYVAAYFYVSADTFPTEIPADFNYEEFSANFDAYITDSVTSLNDAAPVDFTPSLNTLDAVLATLSVNPAVPPIAVLPPNEQPTAEPTTDPNADPTLGGLAGSWTLIAINTPEAAGAPLAEPLVTLAFSSTGVAGTDGCNSLSGSFQYEGTALTVGPLASTMMACEESIMQQATLVTSILQTVTGFFIENDTLRLTGPNGDLVFTRSA